VSPSDLVSSHTISVLVDNEPGILARVVGLFSGRGYNIESLTVAETDAKENLSRITIVTKGTPMIIEQIKAQLDRLVPVHRVRDLTVEGPHIERELALVKVRGTGDKRVEALRLADDAGQHVHVAHMVLLVLDASTGQNAQEQAKQFTEVAPITALALTKLDGTAKGGVAISISDQFKIPIKYIGVGESIDKLQIFNKRAFVESLFN